MKKGRRGILLTLLLLSGLFPAAARAAAAPPPQDSVTIGIVGDQTGVADNDLAKAYKVLQQGVNALKQKSLDVVIHTGDLVESTLTEDQIRENFGHATAILSQLPVQWYLSAGDHDVNPPNFQQNSTDRSRETLFKQLYSQINPKVANQLYYSFDVNGYHFIALYSLEHLHTDPRWGNVFFSEVSDAQYNWLEQDLQASAGAKGIVVFLHQPMWYNWSIWSRVHELLKAHPTRAVVAGHFHYNQIEAMLDGIQYWVVGAAGGETKTGNPNSGDLQHVTVLKIQDGSLTFTMIPLAPFTQDQWTPRYVMDRVQAIDQTLGNLWDFAQKSPLFLKNGVLVKSCDSADPAQLVLQSIGNPTQFPATITINVTPGSSINVAQGTFAQGACQGDVGKLGCLLAPSALVPVSNTSLVQTQFPGAHAPPPLWTGTIAAGSTPPTVGMEIQVQVILSFQANQQTYLLSKSVSASVQGCSEMGSGSPGKEKRLF